MYTIKTSILSTEPVIEFSLPYHDWKLLEESEFWGRLDRYLEACQSTNIQMSPQERIKILENRRENMKNRPLFYLICLLLSVLSGALAALATTAIAIR